MDKKLKFEQTAEVGDVIRAYDFQPMKGRSARFVEGRVIEKVLSSAYKHYLILCDYDSAGGARVGSLVKVPFEVNMSEFHDRVLKLS